MRHKKSLVMVMMVFGFMVGNAQAQSVGDSINDLLNTIIENEGNPAPTVSQGSAIQGTVDVTQEISVGQIDVNGGLVSIGDTRFRNSKLGGNLTSNNKVEITGLYVTGAMVKVANSDILNSSIDGDLRLKQNIKLDNTKVQQGVLSVGNTKIE